MDRPTLETLMRTAKDQLLGGDFDALLPEVNTNLSVSGVAERIYNGSNGSYSWDKAAAMTKQTYLKYAQDAIDECAARGAICKRDTEAEPYGVTITA